MSAQNKTLVGFGRAFQPTRKPDAVAKMLAGSGLAPDDFASSSPLNDPFWLTPEKLEDRRQVMRDVDFYENGFWSTGIDSPKVTAPGGFIHDAQEFVDWQRKRAYFLLSKGADLRQVAAEVFREPAWVEAIRQEFQIF